MPADVVHIKEWIMPLLPHPCNQCTTHQCLPFITAAPPTLLTWPRWGVTAVTALTNMGRLRCDFTTSSQKRYVRLITATIHSKNITLVSVFFLRNNHSRNTVGQTKNSEWLTQESDSSRNDASSIITHCLYGWCTGTRKDERYLQKNSAYGNDA
jgi:hypothetical protein